MYSMAWSQPLLIRVSCEYAALCLHEQAAQGRFSSRFKRERWHVVDEPHRRHRARPMRIRSEHDLIRPPADVVDESRPVVDCEWIVTNGIGGYASGTIVGVVTRRYHGVLVAALNPPLGRTVLVAKVDESVSVGGDPVPLFANQWNTASSPIEPNGFLHLVRFRLDGTMPVWSYEINLSLIHISEPTRPY